MSEKQEFKKANHVVLTSHINHVFENTPVVNWGEKDPKKRGPIIATVSDEETRNAIGTHSGSYTVYRALSIAKGEYDKDHRPDLFNTHATTTIGPHESWYDPEKIVSLDPWGGEVQSVFKDEIEKGLNVKPTIAVTQARLQLPEIYEAIEKGRLKPDGKVITENGDINVTKVALEPVWYLPGIAKRLNTSEGELRKILFKETGGMFPELVTRPDLKVLLPPIGSTTAYIF